MRRRDAIRTGLVTGASLFLPRAATAQTRPEGRLPDTSVPTKTVTAGVPVQLVPAEAWVIHRLGTYTTGDEGPDALREMRDKPEYRFRIDGELVESPGQFWGDIHRREDERLGLSWQYTLPPQPEGDYRFEVEIEFPTPIQYTDDHGREQVWEGTETFDCTYRVRDLDDAEPALGHSDLLREFEGFPDE